MEAKNEASGVYCAMHVEYIHTYIHLQAFGIATNTVFASS